jgi:TonB family protein
MFAQHGFLSGVPLSVPPMMFFTDGVSSTQVRLGGFIAASLVLHLLIAAGAGRLDLSGRRLGETPARPDLHATLAPLDRPQFEAAPANVPSGAAEATKESTSEPLPTVTPPRPATAAASAEEPAPGLPTAEKWYPANELDVRAEPLSNVELRYPEKLRDAMVMGKVRLRLFIDERGVVRKMQIAGSEPAELFDEAAKQAWEDVRFSPALKNGVPVKSQKLLELTYDPR